MVVYVVHHKGYILQNIYEIRSQRTSICFISTKIDTIENSDGLTVLYIKIPFHCPFELMDETIFTLPIYMKFDNASLTLQSHCMREIISPTMREKRNIFSSEIYKQLDEQYYKPPTKLEILNPFTGIIVFKVKLHVVEK